MFVHKAVHEISAGSEGVCVCMGDDLQQIGHPPIPQAEDLLIGIESFLRIAEHQAGGGVQQLLLLLIGFGE